MAGTETIQIQIEYDVPSPCDTQREIDFVKTALHAHPPIPHNVRVTVSQRYFHADTVAEAEEL
jgi:hypothetical protein